MVKRMHEHKLGKGQRVMSTNNYAWWPKGETGKVVGFGLWGSYFVVFDKGGQDLVAGCDVVII